MKYEKLHLPGNMSVETGTDFNGRWFVAYKSGCSMYFRDVKELRRFLKLPLKTASRESLDSWLASLAASERAPVAAGDGGALDASDPNFETRVVI